MPKSLVIFSMAIWLTFSVQAQKRFIFPLRVGPDNHHLIDQNGIPFLYAADAAWQLLTGFTEAETREYLKKRKEQGFNTIQVMLTSLPGLKTSQGHEPFENYDFSKPNEAYFRHVDRVVALADSMNLLLAMAPLWQGCCQEGWNVPAHAYMQQNGKDKCFLFGQFIGQRYKRFANIVWMLGGGNDPHPLQEEIRSLARGIEDRKTQQLMTYHAAASHSSSDVWEATDKWLTFSTIFTYFRGFTKAWNPVQPDVYEMGYTEYRKIPTRPFVLGGTLSEGEEGTAGSELQTRKQIYWSILSGGCGYSYSSLLSRAEPGWQKKMELPAVSSLKYLHTIFAAFDWYLLVPDIENKLIISGNEKYATNDYATAALTRDGRTIVVYVPSARELTLNTTVLSGKLMIASWYNTRTGQRRSSGTYPTGYKMVFDSPDKNDWLLVLQVTDVKN